MANSTYGAVKLATLTGIANAIRTKSGTSAQITPDNMAAAISNLGSDYQFALKDVYHPMQFLCPWINLWADTTRGWEIEFNITRDSSSDVFNICNRMYTGSANKGFLMEITGNTIRFSGSNVGFGVFTIPYTEGHTYKVRRNYNEPGTMYIYDNDELVGSGVTLDTSTDYATPFNFFGASGNTADTTNYQPGTINTFGFKYIDS